jgi:hypothetical protein
MKIRNASPGSNSRMTVSAMHRSLGESTMNGAEKMRDVTHVAGAPQMKTRRREDTKTKDSKTQRIQFIFFFAVSCIHVFAFAFYFFTLLGRQTQKARCVTLSAGKSRKAAELVGIYDGGNWIDPPWEKHFAAHPRILEYYHTAEHLHEAARAACLSNHSANGLRAASNSGTSKQREFRKRSTALKL